MRRIIERVVTVVTTTTWKIYWQEDGTPADPASGPAGEELPEGGISSETVQDTQQYPPAIEEKEVDLWVEKSVTKKAANKLSDDPYFNSDEERK